MLPYDDGPCTYEFDLSMYFQLDFLIVLNLQISANIDEYGVIIVT